MRGFWTVEAELDLIGVAEWSEEHHGVAQRDHYIDQLQTESNKLPDYHRSRIPWSIDKLPGIWGSQCQSHALYFRIVEDGLEVVRVLHERQDPTRHIKK